VDKVGIWGISKYMRSLDSKKPLVTVTVRAVDHSKVIIDPTRIDLTEVDEMEGSCVSIDIPEEKWISLHVEHCVKIQVQDVFHPDLHLFVTDCDMWMNNCHLGTLDVENDSEDLELFTVNCLKKMDIYTKSGDVTLQGHCGFAPDGKITTGSGDIKLTGGTIRHPLSIRTRSGDVRLTKVWFKSPRFEIKTTSGDVTLDKVISECPDGSIRTRSGDVKIKQDEAWPLLPVKVTTSSGDLQGCGRSRHVFETRSGSNEYHVL
jgi:hypothetical protein